MIGLRRGKANNGRMVKLDLPDFAGSTRLIESGPLAEVAYQTDVPADLGSTIEIEGEEWTIVRDVMSPRIAGVRMLSLRKEG